MIKFDDGIVQGYIDHEAKRVHFYGAWQVEDWLKVGKFWPNIWRGLWGVHSGFAELADRAMKIPELPKDLTGWIVSGHSMGGAIAQLVGYITGAFVETAGSSRIALFTARRLKNVKHKRWVTEHDPVQYLPFAFWGFRHYGEKIIIPSTAKGIEAHEPKEYQKVLPWVTYP